MFTEVTLIRINKQLAMLLVMVALSFSLFLTDFILMVPAALIRAYLLSKTPIGTDIEQVRTFTDKRGWRDHRYREDGGFSKQDIRPVVQVGVKSIRGNLGDYRAVFRTNVTAFWGFDADGKLIDVWVWKTRDAP